MRLVSRLFIASALLVVAAVGGVIIVVDRASPAVMLGGLAALVGAAVLAWRFARDVARPLVELSTAARAIAAGQPPTFPDSGIPEIAAHIHALRTMHDELARRFAELRREREDTATLIETMADGVLASDARSRIVTLNTAARRLLGYGPSDSLPALTELFHDKPARDLVDAILAGREAPAIDVAIGPRALLLAGRALPNGGALLVMRDVSELRRLETVRRDFVANLSHELKTPLTSIAGYAETLAAEAAPDTEAEQFARTILNNARRMQRLVDNLLDLSRIESGRWQPAPQTVDIALLSRETWASFATRALERQIGFAIEVVPASAALTADPDAVRQILTNLLENALRHTPAGGRIRVTAAPAPGGVTLAVSDTGAGIAAEHLPRIFERFYRADTGRSRDEGGTGLGLAIVKHLVEAHGGWVEARSARGAGTTIRMFFPAAEVAV